MIGVVEASIEIDGNVSGLPALPLVASLGNGSTFLGINIILQSQRIPFFCTKSHFWCAMNFTSIRIALTPPLATGAPLSFEESCKTCDLLSYFHTL